MNSAFDPWSSLSAFFSDSIVQVVFGVVSVLVVVTLALYVLSKLRDSNTDNQQVDDLLRKNFEEMRSEGDIDDQEFRKIKLLLSGVKKTTLGDATTSSTTTNEPSPEIDADPSKDM